MWDIDKIFGLFTNRKEKEEQSEIIMKSNNYNRIDMFMFVLNNFKKIENLVKKRSESQGLEIEEGTLPGLIYDMAWGYIKGVELNTKAHIADVLKGKLKYSGYLDIYIEKMIEFYETIEYYERCAFLKKILNKIQLKTSQNIGTP